MSPRRFWPQISTLMCLVLALIPATSQAATSPNRFGPQLPDVWFIDAATGKKLQTGVISYYYWEDGDKTYRWYDGWNKPDYEVHWPERAATIGDEELRFRVDRLMYPDAGLVLEAWPRVTQRGFPRGEKVSWDCYINDPVAPCHYEPVITEGRLQWDVVADIPEGASELFVNFQPAWFNNEDAEPTHIQEGSWLFHLRVQASR